MTHNHPKTKEMDTLQLKLREARKTCADDGYNGKFCAVFDEAITAIGNARIKAKELNSLLWRYGSHPDGCARAMAEGQGCTCGLADALELADLYDA